MSNKIFGDILDQRKWGESPDLISNTDFIGVEVELEGIPFNEVDGSHPKLSLWKVVEDGSLRNGCEFIFK